MRAVVDGTARAYRVERAWYHPAILRQLDFKAVAPTFRGEAAFTKVGSPVSISRMTYVLGVRSVSSKVCFLGYPIAPNESHIPTRGVDRIPHMG
jgi:hypothetical protein